MNKKVDRIAADALDLLKRYAWPGNLRELENIVERAVVLASERTIEAVHLPLHIQGPTTVGLRLEESLVAAKERLTREFEREAVLRFLAESRGNVSMAARAAGTTRRNFHRLLLKYSIDASQFRHVTDESQV